MCQTICVTSKNNINQLNMIHRKT